jgi:hypothetical protein
VCECVCVWVWVCERACGGGGWVGVREARGRCGRTYEGGRACGGVCLCEYEV